jgi:hypothetical protein
MKKMNNNFNTVAETLPFIAKANKIMTVEEKEELISFVSENPKSGTIISGTGGVRKVRFARKGQGKSGGFRIIYYFYTVDYPVYLFTVFAKNEKDNLTDKEKKEIYNLVQDLKSNLKKEYRK